MFGIQIGFARQNANMSRIFQTLGGSLDDLSYLLLLAVLWTVGSMREYSPEQMALFGESDADEALAAPVRALASRGFVNGFAWIFADIVVIVAVPELALQKEVYLLGGLLASTRV